MMKTCKGCGGQFDKDSEEIQQIGIFFVFNTWSCLDCINRWDIFTRKDPSCIEHRRYKAQMEAILASSPRTLEMLEYTISKHTQASQAQYDLEIEIAKLAAQFFSYKDD